MAGLEGAQELRTPKNEQSMKTTMQGGSDRLENNTAVSNDLSSGSANGIAAGKTPVTSDWEQVKILCRRNLNKDKSKPLLWFARTLAVALFVMMYTVGFYLNYRANDDSLEDVTKNLQDGDYIFHESQDWAYPEKLIFHYNNDKDNNNDMYPQPWEGLSIIPETTTVITTNDDESEDSMNFTEFQTYCQDHIDNIYTDVCVYMEPVPDNITNSTTMMMMNNSETAGAAFNYFILYGGDNTEGLFPYAQVLAGTQNLMSSLLLSANSTTTSADTTINPYHPFAAKQVQRTPEQFFQPTAEDITNETRGIGLTIGLLICLAVVVTSQFLVAPVLTERKLEVTQAFVRVGVRLRTYMLQWMLYLGLNSILAAAALTAVAVGWKLYPQSSAGLIFGSFYLALLQLDIFLVLFAQVASDEESAGSLAFLFFLISVAIAAVVMFLLDNGRWLLSLLSIVSPYIGILNFSMRYYEYDIYGYGTGISVSNGTFVDSGMLGSYLGSFVGVLLYLTASIVFSTPSFSKRFKQLFSFSSASHNGQQDDPSDQSDNHDGLILEPLNSQADVLLHMTDLQHTYFPGCSCFDKSKKPVEVLQGVDLDVTRNSVLGLLGHNGCGKSTTIKILSGELDLQDGLIQYNFLDGTVEWTQGSSNEDRGAAAIDVDAMKRKIGVCPQHNNLLGDESCRETLKLFASLRGNLPQQPNQSIDEATDAEVDRIIREIDFTSFEDADKPVGTYSGGMKRKVSIGIALIGDPEIVFLDEPSAGLDPYNRRTIWDLIIGAKKNRSIVLCSHHLEEVDLLSDRVAIMNDGKIVACGSPLFLKHHYGGYSLRFEATEQLDVSKYINGAESLPMEKPQHFQWKIEHGSEPYFASLLAKLDEHGAKNVALELTTLEQVFLETSKEEQDLDATSSSSGHPASSAEGEEEEGGGVEVSLDQVDTESHDKASWLSKIWEKRGDVVPIGFWQKFFLVQGFMNRNAMKQKGSLIINVTFPLVYMVGGLVVVFLVGEPDAASLIVPDAIPITPAALLGDLRNGMFFGVPESTIGFIDPIFPVEAPEDVEFYFDDENPVLGGYWAQNETLQYNDAITPFALQLSEFATSAATLSQNVSTIKSINVNIQQLPFISEVPFRTDFLLLPIALVFGFTGMVMSVLDILTLKGNNAASLFRVAGVNEWTVYLGVMYYKCTTTFMPFFTITVVLSIAFKNVLFGNGGRWLASLLTLLLFAYSSTPIGLIIGKRFVHKDFDSVKGWFPGAYFTLISLPYLAWNLAYQNLPNAQDALLIVGDVLCLIPPVAFQRSLGAIIEVSLFHDDPELGWDDVWKFETRVLLSIILMFGVGTLEWIYLYRLTTTRPAQTRVEEHSDCQPEPTNDPDVLEEKERSLVDDDGINAREVVKVFATELSQDGKKTKTMKKAVKGVNFGIKKNEIYVLLGPNGAGKTSLMSTIAAEYTPEHGSVAIDDRVMGPDDRSTDHMFDRCNVSWCPQADALFPQLSVNQHLEFYARMRGLDWGSDAATQHIDAIVRLLGLSKHVSKLSTELSGGYKRRLSLALAMIGYPSSMLVDECTTGVDPGARHLIWGVLQPDLISEVYNLPAILLSTHYMDEAAKLASRIGIMINGEMVASGSLDRLQQRYCGSYFIEIAVSEGAAESVEEDTVAAFGTRNMEATVYESIPFNFKLQVPFLEESGASGMSRIQQLISIFDLLETKKNEFCIKFYSVAQMSLEQIFIDLSRQQFDADESQRENVTSRRQSQRLSP